MNRAGRRWTPGDLAVLGTLVRGGDSLASLSARLQRPPGVITLKCAELKLTLRAPSSPHPSSGDPDEPSHQS